MFDINLAFNKPFYTSIALLLVAVMTMLLFKVNDPYCICLFLLIGCWIIVGPLSFRQMTFIDYTLCLITFFNILSCLYANCPELTIYSSIYSLLNLTAYFILRKLIAMQQMEQIILQSSLLPFGIALLLAICSFFIFRQSVLNAGFQDTYHFRFLFRPLGYITNIWAEILLIILGWLCLLRRYSYLFVFLTLVAILLSFSRGAYIALGAYLICWLLFVGKKWKKLHLLILSITAIALVGLLFPREMRTTLLMNQTVSQKQSANWRITATQATWEAFWQHPILGYGNENYTFAIDQKLNQDSTLPYTSLAPNVVSKLLIENGVIGCLLYLLLGINICCTIYKNRKQQNGLKIGCLLLALVLKEMTQATLLNTSFSMFMIYVLLAFLQKDETIEIENIRKRRMIQQYILPGIVFLCYIGWSISHFQQTRNLSYLQQSEDAFKKGNIAEAVHLMEQTNEQIPNLVNRGLLYMQCYQETKDPNELEKAEQALSKAHKKQPNDLQILYLQAQVYVLKQNIDKAYPLLNKLSTDYPKNSLYLFSLSDIMYQKGEKEKALQLLVDAISYTPRLLTGTHIRDLQQTDSLFYSTLLQKLSKLDPGDSPADFARYGYIAQWCGQSIVSKKYLQKATKELPNLATPWHLLGDDHKYRLLIFGSFRKNLFSIELPKELVLTDGRLLKMHYQPKFQDWYGSKLNFLE